MKQKIENQTGQNKLEGKEVENWKPYDYFLDKLTTLPKDTNRKKNYEKLMLSLLRLQPPL